MRVTVIILLVIFGAGAASMLVFDLYNHFVMDVPAWFTAMGQLLMYIDSEIVAGFRSWVVDTLGIQALWTWFFGPILSAPAFFVFGVVAALMSLLMLAFKGKERRSLRN